MKKTISIIGSAGIPSKYGGFETLAEQISQKLAIDYNVIVVCSRKIYTTDNSIVYKGVTRVFISLKPNGISSILYDILSILKVVRKSDYLLILGSSAAFFIPLIRFVWPKVKIIYHPDGIEWKRPKWNLPAKAYLKLSSQIGSGFAHKIIIDNAALLPHYEKYKQKTTLISYGGNQYHLKKNNTKKNYWLTIARCEPENSLITIADFFAKQPTENWILVSNFEKTKLGKILMSNYSNKKNIRFVESEYYNSSISKLLNECKGYIHGHSAGGTNPSLVAAMWADIPIICHNNIYNRTTSNNLAAYFTTASELKDIILNQEKIASIKSLDMKLYAIENYSWEKISSQYSELFKS